MHDLSPAAREMTRLVHAVRDDQLGGPTPCARYTLGDLLQHVRGLTEAFTVAGRKEQPTGGSKPPPQGDASLLPADWRDEIAHWLGRLVDTWSDQSAWKGTTWIAGFEAPASAVGVTAANELVVHGWDVARASGQQFFLDDTALAPSLEFVSMMSGPGSEEAGNGQNPAWSVMRRQRDG